MRRTWFRSVLAFVLCFALGAITFPLRGEIAPAPVSKKQSHCCAAKAGAVAVKEHDRGNKARQSCPMDPIQQRQCCAACALSLTLFLGANASLVPPNTPNETLADLSTTGSARADRPPVPPPRSLPV